MIEGLEVTFAYDKPGEKDEPDWMKRTDEAIAKAPYEWNAKCKEDVAPFESCISTGYQEVMKTDEAFTFCIDYCFSDDAPGVLTPAPTVTLEPTPMPTVTPFPTWSPTPKPTPMPTTASPTWSPTPQPTAMPTTAAPTWSPTHAPSPMPTTAMPTWSPTPKPTAMPTTAMPTWSPTPKPTLTPTVMPTPMPSPFPTVTLQPTPLPTLPPPMPTCLVCFRDTGDMVDYFASRLEACEKAILGMNHCLTEVKPCDEEIT